MQLILIRSPICRHDTSKLTVILSLTFKQFAEALLTLTCYTGDDALVVQLGRDWSVVYLFLLCCFVEVVWFDLMVVMVKLEMLFLLKLAANNEK